MTETAPPETKSADAATRLGAEMRAARLSLGWELPELANSLRIREPYLQAIEAGRMSELPGTAYALGFIRSYAAALGMSGEDVTRRLREDSEEVNRRPALAFPAPVPQRGVPAGAVILLGLVIAAGGYAGWYKFTADRHTPSHTVPSIPDRLVSKAQPAPPPSPQIASILPGAAAPAAQPAAGQAPGHTSPIIGTPAPGSASPIGAPTAPPQAQPGSPAAAIPPPAVAPGPAAPPAAPPVAPSPLAPATRVVLKFSADAWITIKRPVGPPLLIKLMHAGDSFAVPDGQAGLTLTTGNAGATEIDLDGKPVPSLGASGLVRHDVKLDPANLGASSKPASGTPLP